VSATAQQTATPAAWRRTIDGWTDRLLLRAAALFTVAVLVHNADHLRRGAHAVTWEVFWLGTLAIPIEIGIVLLVYARHRLAPLAAAAAGSVLAVGYLAVHFLPTWSALSDSFTSSDSASPLSWSAASLEVVAAVTLAVVGFITLRQRGGLASAAQPRPDQEPVLSAARHPIALAMALGNATVLVIAFAQLLS
jgi:hypothetical protein